MRPYNFLPLGGDVCLEAVDAWIDVLRRIELHSNEVLEHALEGCSEGKKGGGSEEIGG